MTLEYFDRIYCINLDRRPDRWAEAKAELSLCDIDHCERVPAVDKPHDRVGGCTMSHRELWRRIVAGNATRALIFEDDFQFLTREHLLRVGFDDRSSVVRIFDTCPGRTLAERFGAMQPEIPDGWDLLYLGGSYQDAPSCRIDKHVIRNAGMHTTHAYGISRRCADELTKRLDEAYPDPQAHIGGIDSVLSTLSKNGETVSLTLSPRLFIQRPTSVSDINPQPLGFPWSLTDSTHEERV